MSGTGTNGQGRWAGIERPYAREDVERLQGRFRIEHTIARLGVKRVNNALLRADQIDAAEGKNGTYWLAPVLADAEAGFGGPLNAFELMKSFIEAGAAGV
ncbi:MAG: hypothetical protein H0W31_12615, partial [Actinobacteria bacterium]|nr:hypothetical protein [Actinomycetota bacterium]